MSAEATDPTAGERIGPINAAVTRPDLTGQHAAEADAGDVERAPFEPEGDSEALRRIIDGAFGTDAAHGLIAAALTAAGWTGPDHSGRLVKPPPPCENHNESQHRDRQPPWCNECGWRHGTIQYDMASKLGTPRAERPRLIK